MSITKEVIDALNQRIKDLAANSTPDQLAYLAKSLEAIADKSAVSEIVQMTDGKLGELLSAARSHLDEINSNKEDSISAITEAKTESISEINTLKTNSISALEASSDSHISLLDTRKNTNIAAINSTGTEQLETLKGVVKQYETAVDVPSGSSIMKEIRKRNMIEPGSLPFLFGVLSRYNDTTWSTETVEHGWFKTELGKWSQDSTKTDYILQLLGGSNTYDYKYSSFYHLPQLCFLQGSNGKFIYRKSFVRYNWSDISKYPYALVGVIFVKNATNADITRTFNFWVSSYWNSGYEGAGLFVGTPNNTNINKSSISGISWDNRWYSSSSNASQDGSSSVIVPANKTVAILLYASAYGDIIKNGYQVYLMRWSIKNFRSNFLTTGLEIDIERTLKAWQCPGLSNTYEIWR